MIRPLAAFLHALDAARTAGTLTRTVLVLGRQLDNAHLLAASEGARADRAEADHSAEQMARRRITAERDDARERVAELEAQLEDWRLQSGELAREQPAADPLPDLTDAGEAPTSVVDHARAAAYQCDRANALAATLHATEAIVLDLRARLATAEREAKEARAQLRQTEAAAGAHVATIARLQEQIAAAHRAAHARAPTEQIPGVAAVGPCAEWSAEYDAIESARERAGTDRPAPHAPERAHSHEDHMSDNRKRPIARRFKPETEALLQVYAKSRNITANEAAEQLLHGNAGVVVDAAAEIKKLRAAVTRAENVAAAREKQRDDALADLAAERVTAGVLRAELESAREATWRADAEGARLTRALAEAKRTADKLRIEVERVTEERDTERRLDVAAQEALRADVAREIEANKRLESELAEARAALETKGATDRLAERLETIAVDVDRRACACALPADFEAKLTARAPGWKGTMPELRARVITLGFSRYDALATDAAKRAAERGR